MSSGKRTLKQDHCTPLQRPTSGIFTTPRAGRTWAVGTPTHGWRGRGGGTNGTATEGQCEGFLQKQTHSHPTVQQSCSLVSTHRAGNVTTQILHTEVQGSFVHNCRNPTQAGRPREVTDEETADVTTAEHSPALKRNQLPGHESKWRELNAH